jgi:HEPN domain-containing protein
MEYPQLDRSRLHELANRYVNDAEVLLQNRRWASAYYLVGYAVECALKACLAKQRPQHDFPDRSESKQWYTHELRDLLKMAGLQVALEIDQTSDSLRANWTKVVSTWRPESRYYQQTQPMAAEMFRAVSDTKEGVLQWLKQHW